MGRGRAVAPWRRRGAPLNGFMAAITLGCPPQIAPRAHPGGRAGPGAPDGIGHRETAPIAPGSAQPCLAPPSWNASLGTALTPYWFPPWHTGGRAMARSTGPPTPMTPSSGRWLGPCRRVGRRAA